MMVIITIIHTKKVIPSIELELIQFILISNMQIKFDKKFKNMVKGHAKIANCIRKLIICIQKYIIKLIFKLIKIQVLLVNSHTSI